MAAANENQDDPRAVAAALDELVEEAFGIVAKAIEPGDEVTARAALGRLARLFETGAGWEARCAAERMFRPEGDYPAKP